MINDKKSSFPSKNHELIKKLCERRFGIGADGLVLIRKDTLTDFRMVYFNADGREGSMCGNGGRCAAAFSYREKLCGVATNFMAADGTHFAKITTSSLVQLKMRSVSSVKVRPDHFELDTGSPHYVKFVDALETLDVCAMGRKIRKSNAFRAEGINVNFVEKEKDNLFVRTYERGVENETFSCGTGVVASAIAASLLDSAEPFKFTVRTRGGNLKVSFRKEGENRFRNIILEGPAEFVYQGTIDV